MNTPFYIADQRPRKNADILRPIVGRLAYGFASFSKSVTQQLPLTRLKIEQAVDFRSPERLSDRAMGYGSLSDRKGRNR